jgi:hypothetical protein
LEVPHIGLAYNFFGFKQKTQDDPEYYASMVSGDDIPDKEMRDETDNFVGNVAYEVMEVEARGEDFEPPSELGEDECASPWSSWSRRSGRGGRASTTLWRFHSGAPPPTIGEAPGNARPTELTYGKRATR